MKIGDGQIRSSHRPHHVRKVHLQQPDFARGSVSHGTLTETCQGDGYNPGKVNALVLLKIHVWTEFCCRDAIGKGSWYGRLLFKLSPETNVNTFLLNLFPSLGWLMQNSTIGLTLSQAKPLLLYADFWPIFLVVGPFRACRKSLQAWEKTGLDCSG